MVIAMCGIFGGSLDLVSPNAAELLRHRGPNQQGQIYVQSAAGTPFLMGATRLSVVDKHEVPTPFTRNDAVLSYNGEVYNWRDIRRELETLGHRFETETDTEVVLASYLQWGPKCLERFNGMFAIAIWHDNALFLARDRLGKKPLFYTHTRRGLGFSSELKAIRNLTFAELPICSALEFHFDEFTPFKDVKSVKPGEYTLYSPDTNRLTTYTWWRFPEFTGEIRDPKTAITAFLDLFTDACQVRRLADVPLTIFLSGGVDSSLIQALLRFDVSYTIQFEEFRDTINEQDFVEEFAREFAFEARIVTPHKEDFLQTFEALARSIEFPVGSLSLFPLYCLAQAAHRDGFVVALSGEGADELFNGYFRNELLLAEDRQLQPDLSGPYSTLCNRYFGSPLQRFCRMALRRGPEDLPLLNDFFGQRWSDQRSFAQNLTVLETEVFLQPLLVMADRLSMGNSLEIRNPFLDYRIVEFSARLHDDLKYRDGQGKWILRQALREVVGPNLGIANRRLKHGLPAPVNQWLFRSGAFDRKHWNDILLGECLKQLAMAPQTRS